MVAPDPDAHVQAAEPPPTESMVKLTGPPGLRLPDLTRLVAAPAGMPAGVAPGAGANGRGPGSDPPQDGEGATRVVAGARDTLREDVWDTPDLRLLRWGVALRFHGSDRWTLALPDPLAGGVREHAFRGPGRRPPAGALHLLRAYVRGATLVAVARLRVRRRATRLVEPGDGEQPGEPLVELVDDEVSVLDGRRVMARFRELGVHAATAGADGLAQALVRGLRLAGATDADRAPLYVRALGGAALAPPEVDAGAAVPDPTAAEALRQALARSVARLIRHDWTVRVGEDPEAVHQARVATRRLRSDLRTFLPLLDPDWARELRAELAWLADLLGAVRDPEVQLQRLRERLAALPREDRAAARPLLARLRRDRARARETLLEALSGDRYVALLERLVAAAQAPRVLPPALAPATEVLPPLAARPWRRLRKAVRALDDHPPDEALHDVRIRAKRARYAAEAVAPVVGRPARRFAKAVTRLQDVLGEHQDACVAQEWLRAAAARAPRERAFAAGELVALEIEAASRARAQWAAAWDALDRKKLRSWM